MDGYMLFLGICVLGVGLYLAAYSYTVNEYMRDWVTRELIVIATYTVCPFVAVGVPMVLAGCFTLLVSLFSSIYDNPTRWWLLVPLYFGFAGGIIGLIKVRAESKLMARGLLVGGFLWNAAFVFLVLRLMEITIVRNPA